MNKLSTQTKVINRRNVIKMGLGVSAAAMAACSGDYPAADNWNKGDLAHLIPMVSHSALAIKASFNKVLNTAPLLMVNGQAVKGTRQDTRGRFWAFRLGSLSANTVYTLQLVDQSDNALCAPWPLKTFPAPTDQPTQLKMITYTCAGGPDLPVLPGNRHAFKSVAYRQRMYDLMLEKNPDLIIANGDHIYWDYRSWVDNQDGDLAKTAMKWFLESYGSFDNQIPVLGTANEATLQAVADEQIARPYGVRFRSTPVFFVTDDHDYFDNDDATPELVTFPPNSFHQELRNTLQQLYFPEFIVNEVLPDNFPGLVPTEDMQLSTHFGSFQYGDLFRGLIYDCGGLLSLGDDARLFPAVVEDWLLGKTRDETTRHMAHIPSHPMGWTAGKWREWYPDLLTSSGTLLAAVTSDQQGGKYLWQQGWWEQHQRILNALSAQKKRTPLMLSGDLHALGSARIERSDELDLSKNPVYTVLTGPVGVGGLGWISSARGVSATIAKKLQLQEFLTPEERNGFTVVDFTRQHGTITQFRSTTPSADPDYLSMEIATSFQLS